MKKLGSELFFISRINRDGLSVDVMNTESDKFREDVEYDLYALSLTEKTYIAINFNAFVVKIKPEKL